MKQKRLKEQLYFIGDIHAQHNKLVTLLRHIDFDRNNSNSSVKSGQLVFVGDLIDSVPGCDGDHLALLNQVEELVNSNHAFCLLGNHELNAIGWATEIEQGKWARPHTENNRKQHRGFLDAVKEGSDEHARWITWFKSLPLFLDFEEVKTIHACWDEQAIDRLKLYLNPDNSIKEAHWLDAFDENHELFSLCETLLKGPERKVDKPFKDKTGKTRTHKRIEWWDDSAYEESATPCIIGHYTLSGPPKVLSEKVVCVDFNAAKGDNPLVCYQFDLESSKTPFKAKNFNFYYSR
ncbi:metallophosphoesterase [Vibrio sp. RC27]